MSGRVVLISGGARGIGRALAQAHRDRGDTVVVADREPTSPDQHVLDVRDPVAYAQLARDVVALHGSIDVFHNNAGIAVAGTQNELTTQHWDELIDVDLRGVMHGIFAVYPQMREQRHGHIVTMGSLAGVVRCPRWWPTRA